MGRAGRSIGPITKAIGAELRAERARADVTILKLSSACGVPRSSLARMLKGEAGMDAAALYAVCSSLGVSMHELVARAEAALVPEAASPPAVSEHPPAGGSAPVVDLLVVDGGVPDAL
jgi:transcriptional regulator with XRE-family HTH domain